MENFIRVLLGDISMYYERI